MRCEEAVLCHAWLGSVVTTPGLQAINKHLKEAFYSGISLSRAKLPNSSISRLSLVTHPSSSKKVHCSVLFKTNFLGRVKGGNCTPFTKQLCTRALLLLKVKQAASSFKYRCFSCMSGHLLDCVADVPKPNTSWAASSFQRLETERSLHRFAKRCLKQG